MNPKKLAVLALAMGMTAMAPNAFADNEMMRGDDKGGMRMEKMGEKMKDKMGNKGEHMGQVADQYLQSILGMTTEQFRAELQSGKTVKDIIAAKGLNFETVMKQVREKHEADMKTKLAADVASGKITQAQADQMLKKMIDNETKRDTVVAKALGITVDELTALTASGKTIEQIATEKGISADTIKKTIDNQMQELGKDKKKGIVKKIKNMFKKKTAAPAVVAPTSTVQ